MRTSIEIPDPLFRDLKLAAVRRGVTIKALICESVEKELKGRSSAGYRVPDPLIKRKGRHSIDLTNAQIEDLLT